LFAISDINNAAEDDFADVPAEDAEGDEEDVAPVSFPVRASVTVEKVNTSVLPHSIQRKGNLFFIALGTN
jgi:hypothetical protein